MGTSGETFIATIDYLFATQQEMLLLENVCTAPWDKSKPLLGPRQTGTTPARAPAPHPHRTRTTPASHPHRTCTRTRTRTHKRPYLAACMHAVTCGSVRAAQWPHTSPADWS